MAKKKTAKKVERKAAPVIKPRPMAAAASSSDSFRRIYQHLEMIKKEFMLIGFFVALIGLFWFLDLSGIYRPEIQVGPLVTIILALLILIIAVREIYEEI